MMLSALAHYQVLSSLLVEAEQGEEGISGRVIIHPHQYWGYWQGGCEESLDDRKELPNEKVA